MNFEDEQSRALLAAIVDSSDDAIISKDLNGIITTWNRSAERIFGYTAAEAVGRPVTMLIPEDRLDEEPEILSKIKRGERIRHYQTVRLRKDGTPVHISLTVSPVVDSEGRIIGASKIARDIKTEHQTLESLRQSEERFRVTLNSIGDAVIATDKEGRVTFMNAVAETLTGWKIQEAAEKYLHDIFKIVNEQTRDVVESPVTKVLREGTIVGLANHTILVAKDGTERPIDDSGAPIRTRGRDLTGVVLVFRDVTDRRAAEINALRFAAIVQNSDDGILSKDLSGWITSWNEGARRIFGYSESEAVGKHITMLIPPDLRQQEEVILARLRKGERIDHFETMRITKEGVRIPVSLTISPIKTHEGEIIGASKIVRDISERKQSELALAQTRLKLDEYTAGLEKQVAERTQTLQKTIGELEAFSYSLSHDMRAPIRAIQSFLELVLVDYGAKLGTEGTEMIHKAVSAAQRMDRLIHDLLTFVQLSQAPTQIVTVDVEKLIRAIISERAEFQPPRAEIIIETPLPFLAGNEASLTQCITNLLDNAVKFVAPNVVPRVRIHSEKRDGEVRIWFDDNGIGVDVEGKARLFQMFQRLNIAYPGTGIGLAIVRKAAERIGGKAGVDSEPGKGSRFWLQFPEGGQ